MQPEEEPKSDWARHSYRVLNLIDNQVRGLRKRQTISSFKAGTRQGTYWGIRPDIKDYGLGDALDCPFPDTMALARRAAATTTDRTVDARYRDRGTGRARIRSRSPVSRSWAGREAMTVTMAMPATRAMGCW